MNSQTNQESEEQFWLDGLMKNRASSASNPLGRHKKQKKKQQQKKKTTARVRQMDVFLNDRQTDLLTSEGNFVTAVDK